MLLSVRRRSPWRGDRKMELALEKVFAIARDFWDVVHDRVTDDKLNELFGAPFVVYIPAHLPRCILETLDHNTADTNTRKLSKLSDFHLVVEFRAETC